MAETGINSWDKQEKILKRVKEKEYKTRCWAVNICPWCGEDLHNMEGLSSHHVSMACITKGCEGKGKTIKDTRWS